MGNRVLAIIRQHSLHDFTYRGEKILWIILNLAPVLVMFFVWQTIYQGQTLIAGYSFHDTIRFYYLVALISGTTQVHFEGWRTEQVRNGMIDFYLLRPLPFWLEIFFADLARALLSTFLLVPFLGFTGLLINNTWQVSVLPSNELQMMGFVGILLVAYLLNFMLGFWIVLASFWLEGAQGLEHFKWISLSLFGGSLVPFQMLPDWLAGLISWLPFKYMYLVPVEFYLGNYQWQAIDSLYITGILIFMASISIYFWQAAVRKYSSSGG